ncbi:MAG TPA: hypothetical protein VLB01_01180 [Thermodesulfobacteriota bacterium]|nr:hypothetical protein [Thermodesulfobacteriota bacterium]
MGALESALNGLQELLRREGKILSIREKSLLLKTVNVDDIRNTDISEQDKALLANLTDQAFKGFFKCAADGYVFTPENRIKE